MANDKHYRKEIVTPFVGPVLVVETGSGNDPDANSYCTQAFAQDYMDERLYTDEWNQATPTDQIRALIMATRTLDADCIFRGYRKLTKQPLSWPRVLAKNDDFWQVGGLPYNVYTTMRYWSENELPHYLVEATALQALELLRTDRTADPDTKGLTSLGLGQSALTMTFTGSTSHLPKTTSDEVRKILEPIVNGFRGSGSSVRKVVRVQ
jgi:hypothetical protein